MGSLVVRLLINGAALLAASALLPLISLNGFRLDYNEPLTVVIAALFFGIVNAIIRPLTLAITCLINFLTLGLFTLVVNALMLYVTAWLVAFFGLRGFQVDDFLSALVAAIVIAIVSMVLTKLVGAEE